MKPVSADFHVTQKGLLGLYVVGARIVIFDRLKIVEIMIPMQMTQKPCLFIR
jgi:hypothetical protein